MMYIPQQQDLLFDPVPRSPQTEACCPDLRWSHMSWWGSHPWAQRIRPSQQHCPRKHCLSAAYLAAHQGPGAHCEDYLFYLCNEYLIAIQL